MAIVTSEVVKQSGQNLWLRFQDHTGVWHEQRYRVPSGTDAEAFRLTQHAKKERGLSLNEVGEQKEKSLDGTINPDYSPTHIAQNDFDRKILGLLMVERDVDVLINALPFWDAVQARGGANANARAAYLGVPRTEYDQVAGRMNDLQGVAGGVATVHAQTWQKPPEGWR